MRRSPSANCSPSLRKTTLASDRLKLHVAYAHAMIAAHGHGAPETVSAFVRAHELAANSADMQARFWSNYGLWAGSYLHGDLPGMFEPAQAFLRDVETRPGSPEAGVAHRAYGVTQWFTGNFVEARTHLEHAVAVFDPERDRDLAFRFGQDVGVSAMVYLAIVLWPLGEVDRAREIADATAARIAKLNHLATSTYGLMHCAMFEIIARNAGRAAPLAKALSSVAHEHGIALWIGFGAFLEAWVELKSRPASVALLNMRRAAALLDADGVGAFKPLVKASLAGAEAKNGELKAALATLEEALDGFDRTGQRWFNSEIHRMRGEILLELNPADPALAANAFLPPSASRKPKRPAASNCGRRLRWQNSISQAAAPSTRMPFSPRHSKAFRPRRKCRRSRRHWLLSATLRRERNCEGSTSRSRTAGIAPRDPECPVDVNSRRRSNVSNAQIASFDDGVPKGAIDRGRVKTRRNFANDRAEQDFSRFFQL